MVTPTQSPDGVRRAAPDVDLPVDRLSDAGTALQVVSLSGQTYPEDSDCGRDRPHRHDYHELIWSRAGSGSHVIDGQPARLGPHMLTVIGRGQVHVFERATGLDGALVRFSDELLQVDTLARVNPAWLVGFQGPHTVLVPDEEVGRLDSLLDGLRDESSRPVDLFSVDVQRHLLCTLLLWVGRWHASGEPEGSEEDTEARRLYRRFLELLERDFSRRHEAREYAESLSVPQAVLARALGEVTGRRTKELITERRMLEAKRLLRYSDLSIGAVASRSGFGDQLYFSRAFRFHHGESPSHYRNRVRGC